VPVTSGIYFYALETANFQLGRKMILLK